MPQSQCAECEYPIDYDWQPCSNCYLEGEVAPNPYPPLPMSDDEGDSAEAEDDGGNLYFFDTKGEPVETQWSSKKTDIKWGANITWDSCWNDYTKLIGVLGNFPHVMQEAQLLFKIIQEGWRTREELVVAALDLSGTQLFARSITAIDWHLQKMEDASLIYRITSYE